MFRRTLFAISLLFVVLSATLLILASQSPQFGLSNSAETSARTTSDVAAESTYSLTPRPWGLLKNTVMLAAGVCAVSLPLGVFLAVVIFRTDAFGRRGLLFVLCGLLLLPLYLHAAGWDAGFGQQGWFTLQLGHLGQPLLAGWRGAIWIHAMAAISWVTLIVGVAVRWIDPELEEAALMDGSMPRVFWNVTLPRTAASACIAALWVWLWTAGEMTVTDLFRIRTFAEELYTGFALGEGITNVLLRLAPGILLAVWLSACGIALAWFVSPVATTETPRFPLTFPLGRWKVIVSFVALCIVMLAAAVPVLNLVAKAGIEVNLIGGERVRTWSLLRAIDVVVQTPAKFRQEYLWTVLIAGSTAIAALFLAAPLAWWARNRRFGAALTMLLAAIGLAIPAPLLGLMINSGRGWAVPLYDHTIFAPVCALTVRILPLTLLVLWWAWRSLPSETNDSAAVDGAGRTGRFLRIALPQRWLAMGVAWLTAFAAAAGDLAASILTVPPGVSTISIRTFGLIHAGVHREVAGICLTNIFGFALLTLLLIIGVGRLRQKIRRDEMA